jgi:hypothetical protein
MLDIISPGNDYATLGIPEELPRHYYNRVSLGDYLIVLNGNDIQIAGARTILDNNRIQDFRIGPSVVNATNINHPVSSTNV